MGACGGTNVLETEHKPIKIDIANTVIKSICKISIKMKDQKIKNGTGFFMNISNSIKYLITNYHVINPDLINEYIEIEIWNHKKMKLDLNNYNIKYTEEPKDITILQIKNSNEIYKDIKFLDFDKNYINGYKIYNNVDVFSINHPFEQNSAYASGKIIKIYDYEFEHNISTDNGLSGCPIILLNENINLLQVIGIQKNSDKSEKINRGTFLGEIFKELNNDLKNSKIKDNFIISEIAIENNDINKNIRIINCYEEFIMNKCRENPNLNEEFKKKYYPNGKLNKDLMNEQEIKICEISINDKLIPFSYFHKFEEKGKYKIKYNFKTNLIRTNFMFCECKSLTNIDLSNFDTQNTINMDHMFYGCISLTNIDLSNFNTQNVTNMDGLFGECESLTNIDLSKFNTENTTNMDHMFYGCESLNKIDLSNFNTQNVTNMEWMFCGCKSLTNIDLSKFNTQNVTNMNGLFGVCESLTKIDVSNFNTKNVISMEWMFCGCKSLTKIDLSNFNTQNVTNMKFMFYGCKSLSKENMVVNDDRIIQEL